MTSNNVQGCDFSEEAFRHCLVQASPESDRPGANIIAIERRPSPYTSSFPICEVDVTFADSHREEFMVKQLSSGPAVPGNVSSKPEIVFNPWREPFVYEHILPELKLATARYYGAIQHADGSHWIVLERVAGNELYKIGELEGWVKAARALAMMHFSPTNFPLSALSRHAVPLLKYDEAYFACWIERAIQHQDKVKEPKQVRWLLQLRKNYPRIAGRLAAMPKTFVHGEFYASNILIDDNAEPTRVCPIDWEMAGLGPPSLDVAALVAGHWTEDQRHLLLEAYYQQARLLGFEVAFEKFLEDLKICRLHIAIQWLGWCESWTPPKEHLFDWPGEALRLSQELELLE